MNKETLEKTEALLQSCGLRKTRPRRAVLTALLKADSPLTQDRIAEQIGTAAPDKTTIYRILMILVKHNLIHQAYIHNRTRHFELAHHCRADRCHPHFTCVLCRQTHCLTEAYPPLVQNLPAGFQIHRQQIRLEGVCPECSAKTNG